MVYQLRLQLQSIWQSTHLSPKELVAMLQAWCHQAESASLPSLKAFSDYLHAYAYKSSVAAV
jgi:stearoyl-CoA desaturase (delta-9 desaturase)